MDVKDSTGKFKNIYLNRNPQTINSRLQCCLHLHLIAQHFSFYSSNLYFIHYLYILAVFVHLRWCKRSNQSLLMLVQRSCVNIFIFIFASSVYSMLLNFEEKGNAPAMERCGGWSVWKRSVHADTLHNCFEPASISFGRYSRVFFMALNQAIISSICAFYKMSTKGTRGNSLHTIWSTPWPTPRVTETECCIFI